MASLYDKIAAQVEREGPSSLATKIDPFDVVYRRARQAQTCGPMK